MLLDPDPSTWATHKRRSVPRFRLRFAPLFWRISLVLLLIQELHVWQNLVKPLIPFQPRLWGLAAMIYLTPGIACRAFLISAIVCASVILGFLMVVRPAMVRWYSPLRRDRSLSNPMPFLIEVGERVDQEIPARLVLGLTKTRPGALVWTNRRICFFPYDWAVEPWIARWPELRSIEPVTPRRRVLGFVRGYPDHLMLTTRDGQTVSFAVADPAEVIDRLAAEGAPVPGLSLDAIGIV